MHELFRPRVSRLAIPLGHIARGQIRRTGEQGGGMALTVLILGYLTVIVLVVLIAMAVFTCHL
ncbi:DUF4190 domain-containing protein [Mycobacterium sp. 852002-51152_SCH6134967]|uniref:DUF4190 domain-containing protein n=1 Tax=Mycobacterium sp. 852002-51152_SCH6134967 TaxID=1834096 RepID=UPI0009EE8836|nr:DUF4190 domain-containing protein [Mycobacterium sp. 852002-51152_SCH6134967]